MSRIRLFTLLTACFLAASAAWADDLGYVDCASHPEGAQLFSKARQTPDALGTVVCGERFTILVYGFVFSRVETKDGKIGYAYSNLITPDGGGASASQAAARVASSSAPAASTNAPAMASAAQRNTARKIDSLRATTSAPEKPAAEAGPLFPTPPVPPVTPSDWASRRAPSRAANSPSPAAAAQPAPAAPLPSTSAVSPASSPDPGARAPQPAPAPVTASPSPSAFTAPAADAQPATPVPSQPLSPAQTDSQAQGASAQPAPAQPAASLSSTPPQASSPAQPGSLFPNPPQPAPSAPPSVPEDLAPGAARAASPVPASPADAVPSSAGEPASPATASQPEAAQPAPDPVRSASVRSSWEKPLPGVYHSFLVELYSGYTFDRVSSGGASSNLSGGMGSFGYNLKPWLQILGDTSYNLVSSGGVKNVLYGNHFGGRYFYHRVSRWNITPFVEGLVGGSRFDVTISGAGSYRASDHCLSYKAGGGIDMRVGKHWEVRVIDVDYYRTSFGGTTQNNYWASAGVVLRLFGSGGSE